MIHATTDSERLTVERAILGSMALLPEAAEFAAGKLSERDFAARGLRAMFRAVCRLIERGTPVDAITLAEELGRAGDFEVAGGASAIFEVLEAVPHAAHARFYVQQLQTLNQRHSLKRLSERLSVLAADPSSEPFETIERAMSELDALRAGKSGIADILTASDALAAMDQREKDPAAVIPTGLSELDRLCRGGLRPGQLIIVGGRPGLGKSAWMAQIVSNAARHRRPALFASLEMSAGELAERSLKTIPRDRFAGMPVFFSECSTFSKLAGVLRLARRRNGIELAAIDYLQLIESPKERNELRERQVAAMSRSLKLLAMELGIPVLLGSQLNRESEKRGRPSLADLRESGSIEQDADIVILIAGDPETEARELIIAKQRGGPCGIVRTNFDGPRFWFTDEPAAWTGNL